MMRRTALCCAVLFAGCGGGDGAATPSGAPHASASAAATDTPATTPTATPRPVPVRPRRGETLAAKVTRRTALRSSPGGKVLFHLRRRTEFGSAMVLAVLKQKGFWLGVTSGELANGRLGWVRQSEVKLLRETWSIRVDLSQRRGFLRHRGKRYRSFPLAVGTPTYATPTGRFGVTDRLSTGSAASPYGCCILATSAHQPHVPQDWPGGDRIAIHGTNAEWSVGTAASHGCLRAHDEDIRLLIRKVPLGTPVTVRA
jgi:hypothetical protein